MATAPFDPLIGTVLLGRYEVLRRIGAGGMGTVYVGRQQTVNREVALKVLKRDLMESEPIRERFRREAAILAKLRHPNTVQLIDYGETPDGVAVMVMELLVGQPLSDRLKDMGPMPILDVLTLGIEIARALAEAHEGGLVHRDLKPANIFLVEVAKQVHAKVLDYGIARMLDEASTRLTSTGQVFGTPRYMSPEQALATAEIDSRSDLYSLALILYECLAGQPPFVAQTSLQYMSAHSTLAPPKLRERVQDAPVAFEALLDACLAKDPADRPQNADVVAEALTSIRRTIESGVASAPVLVAGPKGDSAPATQADAARSSPSTAFDATGPGVRGAMLSRHPRLWAFGAAFVAFSAVFVVGVLAYRGISGRANIALDTRPFTEPLVESGEASKAQVDAGEDALAFAARSDGAMQEVAAVTDPPADQARATASADGGEADDAARAATPVEPSVQKKGKGRAKGKKSQSTTSEPRSAPQGDPFTSAPGGFVTGPATMLIPGVGDDEGPVEMAQSCKKSEYSGSAKLSLRGCGRDCAIILDGRCAGRTPAEERAVPSGRHNISVVCGRTVEMQVTAAFGDEESKVLNCR